MAAKRAGGGGAAGIYLDEKHERRLAWRLVGDEDATGADEHRNQ